MLIRILTMCITFKPLFRNDDKNRKLTSHADFIWFLTLFMCIWTSLLKFIKGKQSFIKFLYLNLYILKIFFIFNIKKLEEIAKHVLRKTTGFYIHKIVLIQLNSQKTYYFEQCTIQKFKLFNRFILKSDLEICFGILKPFADLSISKFIHNKSKFYLT